MKLFISLSLLLSLHLFIQNDAKSAALPLFKMFPELQDKVHFIQLINKPTPIESLSAIKKRFNIENEIKLLIKRDDLSHLPLGGNKARKYEFILPEILNKRPEKLFTVGMWGSNHALSTAKIGDNFDLNTELLLGPQPITENVKKKLLAFHALGAKLKYYDNKFTLALGIAKTYVMSLLNKENFYVPPGGTNNLGTLGYVNAYLELIEQVGIENMPDEIVVPMGTAGTAAGLALGSCLAKTTDRVKIIAVGISHDLLSNQRLLKKKVKQTLRFLNSKMTKKIPLKDCHLNNAIEYIKDYSKPGYGESSDKVKKIIELVKNLENINLDGTYSAKAFEYVIDQIKKNKLKNTLFWLTYNSYPLEKIINNYQWKFPKNKWKELPKKFHHIFQ